MDNRSLEQSKGQSRQLMRRENGERGIYATCSSGFACNKKDHAVKKIFSPGCTQDRRK